MSAVNDLAAIQNGRLEAAETRELLAVLLDLPSVDVEIRSALFSGMGSGARVAIDLSNGARMQFDSVKDMASPTVLAAELVACTGALPKITRQTALQAIAYVRRIAHWEATATAADAAFDWGCGYLQAADALHVDLSDQRERWAAFSRLNAIDPSAGGKFSVSASVVLVDTDGTRWVRVSWFYTYLRELRHHYSQPQVAGRMAEVGWTRRGQSGRIKATCPSRPQTLGWSFFIVPAGWEDRGSGSAVPAGVYRNTRAKDDPSSRVENGTSRNRGTLPVDREAA